jgi:hypothetical protein
MKSFLGNAILVGQSASLLLVGFLIAVMPRAASAGGFAWYVAVGYSSPKIIEGPFLERSDCASEANGYNARQPNWAFHCETHYSPSIDQLSDNCDSLCYFVVYAAETHDRILAGPYDSFGPLPRSRELQISK